MMQIIAKLTAVLAVFGLSAPLITTVTHLGDLLGTNNTDIYG
jgi:hypothetical protein